MTVYNENEPFAAEWLEALIADGQIAPGKVNSGSVSDLTTGEPSTPLTLEW